MSPDPLLELFESLQRDFGNLSLDDFTAEMTKSYLRFHLESVLYSTPLAQDGFQIINWRVAICDTRLPKGLREQTYDKLKYKLQEIIHALRTGASMLPRKRLRDVVVNKVTDKKVRQLCIELNSIQDQQVLSIAQLIGETLKWALWHKAKQKGTKLKEDGALAPLIDEAINKAYYSSKVATRFLLEFKTNFMKTGYDMVRHSESYVPDIAVLNPQIDALEVILDETF